ncbi:hypothetical protein ACW7BJ_33445 [Azospirillum argentinense]
MDGELLEVGAEFLGVTSRILELLAAKDKAYSCMQDDIRPGGRYPSFRDMPQDVRARHVAAKDALGISIMENELDGLLDQINSLRTAIKTAHAYTHPGILVRMRAFVSLMTEERTQSAGGIPEPLDDTAMFLQSIIDELEALDAKARAAAEVDALFIAERMPAHPPEIVVAAGARAGRVSMEVARMVYTAMVAAWGGSR